MIPMDVCARFEQAKIETIPMLSLKTVSSFRIGGFSELAVFPDTVPKMVETVKILRESETPFRVIGNASNILFGDGLIEGALILTKKLSDWRRVGTRLYADCGVTLAVLANGAAEASLSGLEFARGIPGTVGGALYMNAGAYGGTMGDVVVGSRALNIETGELLEITEHDFGYRRGIYMKDSSLLCLGAELALREGDRDEILSKMQEFAVSRREKQPLEYPSAGSYFKRPEGHFAGKLIEDCGLKGYRVGGAEVSEKHAGFIINRGGATAEDVLRLEEHIRKEVLARFGVTLEREVRVIQ